jgi:putative NADH-flavin reductase
MKLFIVGATGRTGQSIVEQALERGHLVTALVRKEALAPRAGLVQVIGDPRRIDDVLAALPQQDAMISCLGQNGRDTPYLVEEAARTAIEAMRQLNVKRYLVVSGALLFPSMNPFVGILKRIMSTRLADARAMEAIVRASDLDWTIARPTRLVPGPAISAYRAASNELATKKWSMPYASLAAFLVDAVEQRQFLRQVVGIGAA